MPLLGQADGFDPSKFGWIGNLNKETAVCVAWHTSPVKTFEDLRHRQMIVGTTGKGADLSSFEQPLINLLGAKLKVIRGYDGGTQVDLAMERGEIEGRCGISWSSMKLRNADWLSGNKVVILVQLGFERHPDLPNVPLVQEFAASEDDRKILNLLLAPQDIGRAYFAPQDLPKERLNTLRAAFDATLKDDAFLADTKNQKMQIDPVPGEALQKMLQEIYATPPTLIARARKAVQE
jgi:tripartite-type tricarboxylate transporter receptor subunit TctC